MKNGNTQQNDRINIIELRYINQNDFNIVVTYKLNDFDFTNFEAYHYSYYYGGVQYLLKDCKGYDFLFQRLFSQDLAKLKKKLRTKGVGGLFGNWV